jgi:lipid-A-disaccharide synthase
MTAKKDIKNSTKKTQKAIDRTSVSKRSSKPASPILIIAGEQSGDNLGGELVRSLKRSGYESFIGTGGEAMRAEGVELLESVESMAVVGFVEAIRAYRKLKRLLERIVVTAEERRVKKAILIDYPGFNLRLARRLKSAGIRVIYYVSPQIWAWHYGRIRTIRESVDLMLVLFPFEKRLYEREGVPVEFVGHPMTKAIARSLKDAEPIPEHHGITIALLPGSRPSEVMRHMGDMLEAAKRIQGHFRKKIRYLIPAVSDELREMVERETEKYADLNIRVMKGSSLAAMNASDLVILSSGTATLEAAYLRKPMIIVYRMGMVNFLLASLLVRMEHIGLVNILAGEDVALELIQSELNPENIEREAVKILNDVEYREAMVSKMERVIHELGRGDPAKKAAERIVKISTGRR